MAVTAIDSGTDPATGSQCSPWVFPSTDGHDYYTKLVERCGIDGYREAELMASRLSGLLGAPAPWCEPVFVPSAIASAAGVSEQWAVGSRSADLLLVPAPAFDGFVDSQPVRERAAIVAIHTWLDIGDHGPGHNFFREVPADQLVTIDHCSGLRPFLTGAASPVTLVDPAGLLTRVDRRMDTDVAAVAQGVASIGRSPIESAVSEFPLDPAHPWFDSGRQVSLVDWIVGRQVEVARVLTG